MAGTGRFTLSAQKYSAPRFEVKPLEISAPVDYNLDELDFCLTVHHQLGKVI
jgi:hypothetical protein